MCVIGRMVYIHANTRLMDDVNDVEYEKAKINWTERGSDSAINTIRN